MPNKWGVIDAFGHFGAKCANARWSWSARNEEEKIVVLALWQHLFDYKQRPPVYSNFGLRDTSDADELGNRERVENLLWACTHCDGLFRVVVVVADDPATMRKASDRFPQPNMLMRLLELNKDTGEFRAELVH